MKIYLDNCCFNRPFDKQNQVRIRLEAEAKIFVQTKISERKLELVWSYILEYENLFNPFEERKNAIQNWKQKSYIQINGSDKIISMAEKFVNINIKPKDALHLACAIEGKAKYFLTTDDLILAKKKHIIQINIVNPLDFIQIITKT